MVRYRYLLVSLILVSVSSPEPGRARRQTSAMPDKVPRLPPRPKSTSDPLRPEGSSPSLPPRLATSNKPQSWSTGFAIPRKPAPPIPARSPSMTSVASVDRPSPNRRAAPPVPSARGIGRTASPAQPASPILTPSSTGDYMVVTSSSDTPAGSVSHRPAPPLPPRFDPTSGTPAAAGPTQVAPSPAPVHRPSLDMNGSPPDGLMSPVSPDKAPGQTKQPPPIKPKPAAVNKSSASAVGKVGISPPAIPKKPVALKRVSGEGMHE